MRDDAEAEVFRLLIESDGKPSFSLVDWIKEKPIRRGSLLLWMMEHTDSEESMDEIVTALVSAVKIKGLSEVDASVRASLREALDTWKTIGRPEP